MSLFDERKDPVVFEFGIDGQAKAYMLQTARWTMFLSIMGFITIFLLFGIAGIFLYTATQAAYSQYLIAIYVLFGLLYIYPVYALLKFSSNIRYAMNYADQGRFVAAMKHQRNMYAFIGILVILLIVIYGLIIASGMIGLF